MCVAKHYHISMYNIRLSFKYQLYLVGDVKLSHLYCLVRLCHKREWAGCILVGGLCNVIV